MIRGAIQFWLFVTRIKLAIAIGGTFGIGYLLHNLILAVYGPYSGYAALAPPKRGRRRRRAVGA